MTEIIKVRKPRTPNWSRFTTDKLDEFAKVNAKYEKKRYEFIEYCISKRMTYEEIGKIFNVTKASIYQWYRYGLSKLTQIEKNEIKKRDNNTCKICLRLFEDTGLLHIHHIGDPKDNSPHNLMTLCRSCHKKIDHLTARIRRNSLSTGGTLQK